MLTGDAKWYDAVQRVTGVLAAQQDSDRLPGLWPSTRPDKPQVRTAQEPQQGPDVAAAKPVN